MKYSFSQWVDIVFVYGSLLVAVVFLSSVLIVGFSS